MGWKECLPATRGQLNEERTQRMAADKDLQTAVARVATSASAEIKAINDKLAALGSDDPVVIQAVADLNKVADTLDSEVASLAPPQPPAVG